MSNPTRITLLAPRYHAKLMAAPPEELLKRILFFSVPMPYPFECLTILISGSPLTLPYLSPSLIFNGFLCLSHVTFKPLNAFKSSLFHQYHLTSPKKQMSTQSPTLNASFTPITGHLSNLLPDINFGSDGPPPNRITVFPGHSLGIFQNIFY